MIVSLIAAMSENQVIGKERGMPWHMPADLKYFFRTTKGHHVIMGRRTFHEFGVSKPLPDRTNIIVSTNRKLKIEGVVVKNSIQEALAFARKNNEKEAFIIGGGSIYKQSLSFADKIYLTLIHTEIEGGDTFFPEFDRSGWNITLKEWHQKDDQNPFDYTFLVYERTM